MVVKQREWVFVALGSNLGDRAVQLERARKAMAALPGTDLVAVSEIEETEPLGGPAQGPYLNQMVLLHTALGPNELLMHLLAIERNAGRQRRERWAARILDLDIVRFGDRSMASPQLTVPHPELPNRSFWQREIEELAGYVG